jgi:hypothetical protein
MREYWKIGILGLENQNEHNCIDLLGMVANFFGKNRKWGSDGGISIKSGYNIPVG